MDVNRLSARCREVLAEAQTEAVRRGHAIVLSDHLASALLQSSDGLARYLLPPSAAETLLSLVESRLSKLASGATANTFIGADVEALFLRAVRDADEAGVPAVSVGHLLLILAESENPVGELLSANGVTRSRIVFQGKALDGIPTPSPSIETYPTLVTYGRNLTKEAALGKLDPVVGRDETAREIIHVLLRRTKNSPVLVGPAGVGKTAVIESIAERIVRGDVPGSLGGKTLFAIDLGTLAARLSSRELFEERVRRLIREAASSRGEILLFIDEARSLFRSRDGIDVVGMLKPALSEGELRVITATTAEGYRRYFSHDPALEQSFQPVFLEEPAVAETVEILGSLRSRFETHHGVRILDEALVSAAKLSQRYVPERHLPGKAVEILDEAAAECRIGHARPPELEQLEERIAELELARQDRNEPAIEREVSELRTAAGWLRARWRQEQEASDQVRKLRKSLAEIGGALDSPQRVHLEKRLRAAEQDLPAHAGGLARAVREEDVAKVVSRWSGVPVPRLLESEAKKLEALEERLVESVVGQPEAARAIAGVVLRARSGVKSAERPVTSLLFTGPRGVGMTEMAKTLARELFDDENGLVRIHGSELSRPGDGSRLTGAPAGHAGFEQGGTLTEPVRKRPYSVVLLDELEKAHHEVHDLLIELLDEGRLVDSRGRTVSFQNTLLILCTSAGAPIGFGTGRRSEETLSKLCSRELVERLDAVVTFRPLTEAHMMSLVEREVGRLTERMAELGIRLSFAAAAKGWLARQGHDPNYGARPLRRLFEGTVETAIARTIVSGAIQGPLEVGLTSEGIAVATFQRRTGVAS